MRILNEPFGSPGGVRIRWFPMYSHLHSPKKFKKQRDKCWQDVAELFRLRGTGA
jgi:hypothetical protein